MLRTIWLTMQNEARLLLSDPIVLFMLLLAPIVIIAVAGYSLGNIYGGLAGSFRIPVVDLDHGPMAVAIIDALRADPAVVIETTRDEEQARKSVSERARTPIAIVIPAGTSDAIARGRVPNLTLYIDPVRRVEVDGLEVKIADLQENRGASTGRSAKETRLRDRRSYRESRSRSPAETSWVVELYRAIRHQR